MAGKQENAKAAQEVAAIRARMAAYEREQLRHNFPDIDSYNDDLVLFIAESVHRTADKTHELQRPEGGE